MLRKWDHRWAVNFGAYFAGRLLGRRTARRLGRRPTKARHVAGRTSSAAGLRPELLLIARRRLRETRRRFRRWRTPWGDINRFQRLTGDIVQPLQRCRRRAFLSASLRPCGARSPRSGRAPIRGRRMVWHERQQLRRGGGIRRSRTGQGGDRRGESGNPALRTSTIRPSATALATSATFTSTAHN